MEPDHDLPRIIRQQLESLHRAGVTDLLRIGRLQRHESNTASAADLSSFSPSNPSQESSVSSSRSSEAPRGGRLDESVSPTENAQPAMPRDQRIAALGQLAQQVSVCTQCDELARTRNRTVFGVGDPEARLVFLGEAPGADEDRQGEPFVGRAGQLLTKIIEACTLKRDQVYILNILKCRPPGNRNPSPDESANCRQYLFRQLEIIRPEFICCLGAVAAQNLLETTETIGRLRGTFHQFRGIRVLCTYHPAYLLRNPSAKRATWDDMKILMREMGIELPQKQN